MNQAIVTHAVDLSGGRGGSDERSRDGISDDGGGGSGGGGVGNEDEQQLHQRRYHK